MSRSPFSANSASRCSRICISRSSGISGPALSLRLDGLDLFGGAKPRNLHAVVDPDPSIERAAPAGLHRARDRDRAAARAVRPACHAGAVPGRDGAEDMAALHRFLAPRIGFAAGPVEVSAFTLFESHLRPDRRGVRGARRISARLSARGRPATGSAVPRHVPERARRLGAGRPRGRGRDRPARRGVSRDSARRSRATASQRPTGRPGSAGGMAASISVTRAFIVVSIRFCIRCCDQGGHGSQSCHVI